MSHVTYPPTAGSGRWLLLGAVALLGLALIAGTVGAGYLLLAPRRTTPSAEAIVRGAASGPAETTSTATPLAQGDLLRPALGDLAGRYRITSASNPGGRGSYTGAVDLTHTSDHYLIRWQLPGQPTYAGLGITDGAVLGVGWSMTAEYGVAVYRIEQGRLRGRWSEATSPGDLGHETLEGPAGLSGTYRITAAERPGGGSYQGTARITPSDQTWLVDWDLGDRTRSGVGLRQGDTLVVGWCPPRSGGVVLYQHVGNELRGRWAGVGQPGLGTEVLTR